MTTEEVQKLEVGDFIVFDICCCAFLRRIGKIIKIEKGGTFSIIKISWCDRRYFSEDLFEDCQAMNSDFWNNVQVCNNNEEYKEIYRHNIIKKIKDIENALQEYKKWSLFKNI